MTEYLGTLLFPYPTHFNHLLMNSCDLFTSITIKDETLQSTMLHMLPCNTHYVTGNCLLELDSLSFPFSTKFLSLKIQLSSV